MKPRVIAKPSTQKDEFTKQLQDELKAAISDQNDKLILHILQLDLDYYAVINFIAENDLTISSKKIVTLLTSKIDNIFNRSDSFKLLYFYIRHNQFTALDAMLKKANKTKPIKSIEAGLRDYMLDNTYHVPEIEIGIYQEIKKHGYLSDEFIKSMEDFYSHLASMPAVNWSGKYDTTQDATVRMMSTLARNPKLSKSLGSKLCSLTSVDFRDGGISRDNWSDMLKDIVGFTPAPDEKHAEPCINLEVKAAEPVTETVSMFDIAKNHTFLRIQGRTILLEDENKNIVAVKVRKFRENIAELRKEANAATEFQKKSDEMKLQSYFPTPVKIASINQLYAWCITRKKDAAEWNTFVTLLNSISSDENYIAYIYKVDHEHRHYFTYLHDTRLTETEFAAANRSAVADLYKLFANGIVFHQLADIFHNKEQVQDRDDKGRYVVLANLVSYYALQLSSSKKGGGSGRLTGWQEAVAYPNIRGTGLADFGDVAPLKDFFENGKSAKHFFGAALRAFKGKTGNYLMANFLAEYQYVLYLIAGFRACKLTKDMTDEARVKEIWQAAAMQILTNCAQAISILTPQTEDAAKLFLLSQVDVERLGTQMQFWMRETATGFEYLPHVKQNKIPENVYGSEVKVTVSTADFRKDTFNRINNGKEMGFSIDGQHPDLGPVNGQEPVKEKDKLFHWMVTMIFNAYHQHRLTQMDVKRLHKHKKGRKPPEAKDMFEHLSTRDYHATMFSLTKRELAGRRVTRHAQTELVTKALAAQKHKRAFAATTIQETWRAHKFRKVMNGEKEEKRADTSEPKPLFRRKG